MVKLRVSKNLRGTIVLPSVGNAAYDANKPIDITEDQYWSPDVQGALAKKLIVLVSGPSPKVVQSRKVTNLTFGSIALPKVGILRSGKTIAVPEELLKTADYTKLLEKKKIVIDYVPKVGKQQKDILQPNQQDAQTVIVDVDGVKSAKMTKGPKVTKATKKVGRPSKLKSKKNAKDDGLLIDPENDENEKGDDGINFVDVEQAEARIRAHPLLKKKP